MKKVTLENGKKILRFDAKVFIVPNTLISPSEYVSPAYKRELIEFQKEIYELNELGEFSETDELVHLWFHNEDSENIVDHGLVVENIDGLPLTIRPTQLGRLPIKLFEGLKEGDTLILGAPYLDITMDITLTLEQFYWRYRAFGPFEACLEKLKSISANTRRLSHE